MNFPIAINDITTCAQLDRFSALITRVGLRPQGMVILAEHYRDVFGLIIKKMREIIGCSSICGISVVYLSSLSLAVFILNNSLANTNFCVRLESYF